MASVLDPATFDSFDAYVAAWREKNNRSGQLHSSLLKSLRNTYDSAKEATKAKQDAINAKFAANQAAVQAELNPPKTPPASPEETSTSKTSPSTKKKQLTIADMGSSSVVSGGGIPDYKSVTGSNGSNVDDFTKQAASKTALVADLAIKNQIANWKSNTTDVPPASGDLSFANRSDFIQRIVRTLIPGGKTNLGIWDSNDISALKTLADEANFNNISFENYVQSQYQNLQNANGLSRTQSFVKQVTSSANLLDYTTAVEKYSDGYFKTYGEYPSIADIKAYKDYYNAIAERQRAKTTTITTTTSGKNQLVASPSSSVSTTNTITTIGDGFTEEEQKQAMASYLSGRFKDAVKGVQDLGGTSLAAYNQIVQLYRNNYQDVPSFQELAPVITDLVATPEQDIYQVKLNNLAKKIRGVTAMAYPAASDWLNNGNDLNAIGDQRLGILANKWGTTKELLQYDPEAQKLIKDSFNYKDKNGNSKIADNSEWNSMIQGTARYQAGPEAQAWFSQTADKLLNVIGR